MFETQRFMIVDDFQGMRSMLREILKSFGAKSIDTGANGKEAMTLLNRNKYDVVLCDYNLGPGKNGQQILEEAKVRNLIGPATAWIIITAEKTSDMVFGAAEYMPDDYLIKPVTENSVRERLLRVMAKKADLVEIEKAIRAKEFQRAIALCDSGLATSKNSQTELLRIKTGLLIDLEDYAKARQVFEGILAKRDVPWAKTGLAKVALLSGDAASAQYMLQEVISDNPAYLEAHDLLVKTYEQQGQLDEAQRVLERCTELSPNSLARQRKLGEIAEKRGDLDIAEDAYRRTIKLGEFSVLKSPAAYLGLAKICNERDNPSEALQVLKSVHEEFNDRDAGVQAKVLEAKVHQSTGDRQAAKRAIEEVGNLLQGDNRNLPSEVALEAAQLLLDSGETEAASELMQNLVKNNNDDEKLISKVKDVFNQAGMADEGNQLVETSKKEAADTNNRAVMLAKEGKLDEAIEWLRNAKSMLPNNKLILLNFAFVANLYMQKNGKNEGMMREARECLDKVGKLDPQEKKRIQIKEMLDSIN